MTLYFIDVSEYQKGLDLHILPKQGYTGVILKCTEGYRTQDSEYPRFLKQAKDAGLRTAAYHFLHSDSSGDAQARNVWAHVIDRQLRVFIDCEVEGNSRPDLANVHAFADAYKALGGHVGLLYYPKFWWSSTGNPDLKGFKLWQALYGRNPTGYGSNIYPGDNSPEWDNEGHVTPTLLQFGSNDKLTGYGQHVDVSAFRGTVAELDALKLFKHYGATPAPTPAPKPAPTPAPAPKPQPVPAPKPPSPKPVAPVGSLAWARTLPAITPEGVNKARAGGYASRHVWWLQQWLTIARHYNGPITAVWSPATQTAIDNFRHSAGFRGADATGTVGYGSLSKLQSVVKAIGDLTTYPLHK